MTDEDVAKETKTTPKAIHETESRLADFEDAVEQSKEIEDPVPSIGTVSGGEKSSTVIVLLSWAAVGVPLAWGVWITLQKASVLLK